MRVYVLIYHHSYECSELVDVYAPLQGAMTAHGRKRSEWKLVEHERGVNVWEHASSTYETGYSIESHKVVP